jgi:hypothetical protein
VRRSRTIDRPFAAGLDHPDADVEYGVVVSAGGWVVVYDGSVDAWMVH